MFKCIYYSIHKRFALACMYVFNHVADKLTDMSINDNITHNKHSPI